MYSIKLSYLLLFLTFFLMVSCEEVQDAIEEPEDQASEIEQQIGESYLSADVLEFTIVELEGDRIFDELNNGEVTIPITNPSNELVDVTIPSQPAELLAEGVNRGIQRSGESDNGQMEEVPLPSEQSFILGSPEQAGISATGGLTILDDSQSMVQGMVFHPDFGTSFMEPVNLVLQSDEYTGWHVIYNAENTTELNIDEGLSSLEKERSPKYRDESDLTERATFTSTEVVLDGDVEFYEWDESTVWRRQRNNFLASRLLYQLIEPNSSGGDWQLDTKIKGQEVWVSGGPSTTNPGDLRNEISPTQPEGSGNEDYFLINPVDDDDLHVFFVGYAVDRFIGMAWIGNDDIGLGTHSWNEAAGLHSLSFKMRIVAHEVGHNIGGVHGNAIKSGCSGSMCGRSVMNHVITPSTEYFFSDNNDDRIETVLDVID